MKCADCGMELTPSSPKCSNCGWIVPQDFNYNDMEHELLHTVLEDEVIPGLSDQEDEADVEGGFEGEKKKQPFKLAAALLASAVAFAGVAYFMQTFSTGYTYEKTQAEYRDCLMKIAEEDYDGALKSVNLLLEEDAGSLEYLFLKNTICAKQKDSASQIKILKKIIAADEDNYLAYAQLLQLYHAQENQAAIKELMPGVPNSEISAMVKEYLADVPYLELTPGVYYSSQMLSISSENGQTIFYTLDGTSPLENGKQYYSSIPLEMDRYYKVRAVCRNGNGAYGEEASGNYQIGTNVDANAFTVVEQPKIYPDSGLYTVKQTIVIDVPIGYRAYYSWVLGEMLTPENGTLYIGGIPMPEGESILYVIVTDGNGNSSAVKQMNYTYQP